jgi:hypothetical protein
MIDLGIPRVYEMIPPAATARCQEHWARASWQRTPQPAGNESLSPNSFRFPDVQVEELGILSCHGIARPKLAAIATSDLLEEALMISQHGLLMETRNGLQRLRVL